MGNACRASLPDDWSSRRDSVIVLQGNGEVLELRREVRAEELMREFPDHFLCHASSILLRRKSKMIQAKAMLQPGSIYLLLPFPAGSDPETSPEKDEASSAAAGEDPLLGAPPASATGTTRFVISKHYLDRILSKKSSGTAQKKKPSARITSAPSPRRRLQQRKVTRRVDCSSRSSIKSKTQPQAQRKTTISWSPELDSIPEK